MPDRRPTARQKRAVAERAGGRREYCLSPVAFSPDPFAVEHIQPKERPSLLLGGVSPKSLLVIRPGSSLIAPVPRFAAGAHFEQLAILPGVHGDFEVHDAAATR
jgi:hypothetical protein